MVCQALMFSPQVLSKNRQILAHQKDSARDWPAGHSSPESPLELNMPRLICVYPILILVWSPGFMLPWSTNLVGNFTLYCAS